MKIYSELLTIVVMSLIQEMASQGVGGRCIQDGVLGVCTVLGQCLSALNNPQSQWWNLYRCGFRGPEPIICCVPPATTTTQRTHTTPKQGSTTEYIPAEIDYEPIEPEEEGCTAPLPGYTVAKTGRKAWDKCIEYKEELIYPCQESVSILGGMSRVSNCKQLADGLILGGKNANENEYPHMVVLGYGESSESAVWQCGGSLVNEKFVITAGHCTRALGLGDVTYAKVGALMKTATDSGVQIHRIQDIIRHPNYKAPSKYHDIALLKLLVPVTLGPSAVPVCLDIFGGNTSRADATGWGETTWRGSSADILQKVTLTRFTDEECRRKYPRSRNLEFGYDAKTQICYGDYTERIDTCQGDSGGPLTIRNEKVTCTYILIGVTSFGKSCGTPADPGIYTRVSYYVPWIESIVWPQGSL